MQCPHVPGDVYAQCAGGGGDDVPVQVEGGGGGRCRYVPGIPTLGYG